jgi:hypothetical protein
MLLCLQNIYAQVCRVHCAVHLHYAAAVTAFWQGLQLALLQVLN